MCVNGCIERLHKITAACPALLAEHARVYVYVCVPLEEVKDSAAGPLTHTCAADLHHTPLKCTHPSPLSPFILHHHHHSPPPGCVVQVPGWRQVVFVQGGRSSSRQPGGCGWMGKEKGSCLRQQKQKQKQKLSSSAHVVCCVMMGSCMQKGGGCGVLRVNSSTAAACVTGQHIFQPHLPHMRQ